MIKDKILFKGDSFQVSTISKDGILETMVFPIEYGVVSGNEVYCFRTFEPGESMKKHEDILYYPEKYLIPSAIQKYLDSKEEDLKVTDLQKFKKFFDEMNIEYDITEKSNGVKVLSINDKHIYCSYSSAVKVLFEPKHEDFIEFDAWGE